MKPLYQLNANNKIKTWKIEVDKKNVEIVITTGILGSSKLRKFILKVTSGKNIGKTNETTSLQQAVLQAKSKWNKQIDKGYTIEIPEKRSFNCSPMLALDFTKRGHDIKFPCFVQPKFDGVRAVWCSGKLLSRNGKEFNFLEHIKSDLYKFFSKYNLDGELYSDDLSFQDIIGAVKKKNVADPNEKKIYFAVFDIISISKSFEERLKFLTRNVKDESPFIKLVKTDVCPNKDDVSSVLASYLNKNFEGLILRNFTGVYTPGLRSKDLQKIKTFEDGEFLITSFTEGTGIEEGLVIWTCQTDCGKLFNVRPIGTHQERKTLFLNGGEYISRNTFLTVRHQGFTDDGIPRFPVGIAIRNYE